MLYAFNDAKAAERRETQYFEMFCNRGIYHKGWTAVTRHGVPWLGAYKRAFDDDVWELYDTNKDWTQSKDLAKENPTKLAELQRLFLIEATKYSVLPLDDCSFERFNADLAGRPQLIKGKSQVLFGGMSRLSEGSIRQSIGRANAPASDADRRFAQLRYLDGDYFGTLGMRVTSGRAFTTADRSGAPPVVVITEGMAREFFPQTNPLGQRLVIDRGEPTVAEVIGVVSDARLFGQASDAPTTMYMTSRQWPRLATHVVLRMATPSLAGPLLRDTVRSLDRNVAVGRIQSLEQLLHESLSQPRFRTVLAMLFASLALALTLGGLYGSVSWAVAQRTREFGIRSALGARPRQLLTLVLRQGMWIIALGALLGLAGAYTCGRFVQELLYETRPFEANVVTSATILLVALGTVATIVPAWRAGRIDPAVTLRTD